MICRSPRVTMVRLMANKVLNGTSNNSSVLKFMWSFKKIKRNSSIPFLILSSFSFRSLYLLLFLFSSFSASSPSLSHFIPTLRRFSSTSLFLPLLVKIKNNISQKYRSRRVREMPQTSIPRLLTIYSTLCRLHRFCYKVKFQKFWRMECASLRLAQGRAPPSVLPKWPKLIKTVQKIISKYLFTIILYAS